MKKFLAIALSLLLVSCGQSEDSKQASQLIDQYYALDSKTSTGINYVNYTKEVGDLKVSLDKFERNYPNSPALKTLSEIQADYQEASEVWRDCNSTICSSEEPRWLLADFPTGKNLIKTYNTKSSVVGEGDTKSNVIYLNDALTSVWASAKTKLKASSNTIKK